MSNPRLPSKQFLIRGGIATGVVALILIVQTNWFQGLFGRKGTLSSKELTVGDAVAQDSNGNGIPDWEEKLWGLDPTALYTGDMSNREIIETKKVALGLTAEDGPLTENDRLARQLFSISTALGNAEGNNINTAGEVATTLGNATPPPVVTNKYRLSNLRTIATSASSLTTYQKNITNTLNKYPEDTVDVDLLIGAVESGDMSRLPELANAAATYRQLAKELASIAVPLGVVQYHLDIINGYAGVAESFVLMSTLNEDGVRGLAGIAVYKDYALGLTAAQYDLQAYLIEYGIL
ncbi:MAG TPA: hypothetical protein VGE18_03270 [Candidatus Paceibacterota bacterium]